MATEPGLNPDERDERLGGSTPSASVINFRGCFGQHHRYLAASPKAWQSLNSDKPGKTKKQTTRPRNFPGPCFINMKPERKKRSNMPIATPPTEPSVNPKVAFEQLLAQAVNVRDGIQQRTANIMVALDLLALETK